MAEIPQQTITPYLLYEDARAALDFLSRAFGFEEIRRSEGPDGTVSHAELSFRRGQIHLGQPRTPSSPRSLGGTSVLLYVYADDVDQHCARARAAGAEIVEEPADQPYGERRYHCRDPEGHSWYFAQPLGG
ncbi:MAG TPA: VOC family protein [Gaiellaceae bacterium]